MINIYVHFEENLVELLSVVAGSVPMMPSGGMPGIPMQPMHPPPPAAPRPPPLPPGRPPGDGAGNMKSVEDAVKFLPPSLGSFLTRLPRPVTGKILQVLLKCFSLVSFIRVMCVQDLKSED